MRSFAHAWHRKFNCSIRNSIAVHGNFIAIRSLYLICPFFYLGKCRDAFARRTGGKQPTFRALINATRASKLARAQYGLLPRLLSSHARLARTKRVRNAIPFIWSCFDRLTRNICKPFAPHRVVSWRIAIFWDHPAIDIPHWIIAALCTEEEVRAIWRSWHTVVSRAYFKSSICGVNGILRS